MIPPRQVDPRVPRRLESICLRAMAREPADRHAGADELERDLCRYLRRSAVVASLWALGAPIRALATRARYHPSAAGPGDDLSPSPAP